jgi:hypothetical protein
VFYESSTGVEVRGWSSATSKLENRGQ